MNIISISGATLIIATISIMLKKYLPEYRALISISAGLILMSAILIHISPIIYKIKNMVSHMHVNSEYIFILFKSLGICLITQFTGDSCRDAGENSLASKVELAGKLAVLGCAFPLFENIINCALELIGVRA